MGAAPVSSQVMFILSTQFKSNPLGWDTPAVLNQIGIKIPPSLEPSAPIPAGLTREKSIAIARFIQSARGIISPQSRMLFIRGGNTVAPDDGRDAWKKWYASKIAPFLNRKVDGLWKEYGLWAFDIMLQLDDDEFPNTEVLCCHIEFGVAIFGPCVGASCTANAAQPSVKSFLVHNVLRLKKAYTRQRVKLLGKNGTVGLWVKLVQAMEKVTKAEEVSRADVKVITKLMADISPIIMYSPERSVQWNEYNELWSSFLSSRGVQVQVTKTPMQARGREPALEEAAALGKRIKWAPVDIANDEQIRESLSLLVHHFESRGSADFEFVEDLLEATRTEAWAGGMGKEELGVEHVRGLTPEELNRLLGFADERPASFAKFMSPIPGRSAWVDGDQTPEEKAQWDIGGEGLVPLKLKWHQLCGIASMVQKTFVKEGDTISAKNILLADDVGVGKTAEIMGLIAFLIEVFVAGSEGKPLPEILSPDCRRSFMGRGPVPDAPHLLIVPNSLIGQWWRELRKFFAPHAIDIFELPSNAQKAETFFKEGPWVQSKRENIRKVVLCSHTALNAFTHNRFSMDRPKSTPVDEAYTTRSGVNLDRRGLGQPVGLPTIFGRHWCTTVVDEIHEFRVPTNKGFIGTCELQRISHLVVGATATPLISQPRDILSIGRMLNVSALRGIMGNELERNWNSNIRKATKDLDQDDRDRAYGRIEDLMKSGEESSGANSQDYNPSFTVTTQKYLFVRVIRDHLRPFIIRRTINSLNWEGKPINELKPKQRVNYLVNLTDSEMVLLQDELQASKKVSKPTYNGYEFEAFLSRYRLTLAHPTCPDADGSRLFPFFKTKEEYDLNPGSKLTALITILQHHLADDNATPLETYDMTTYKMIATPSQSRQQSVSPDPNVSMSSAAARSVLAPNMALVPRTPAQQPTLDPVKKILVYFVFSVTATTIASALYVHGIHPYVITGHDTAKKRDEIVDAWRQSSVPSERVLLFSQVGTMGHNLADASIVIHFDQNWSSLMDQQIDGRAWRLGQKHTVIIYHIMGLGTPDMIMHTMSNEKDTMLKGLVHRDVEEVFSAVMESEPDAEEHEIPEGKAEIEAMEKDDGDDDGESLPQPGPSKKPSAKSTAVKSATKPRKSTAAEPATQPALKASASQPAPSNAKRRTVKPPKTETATSKATTTVKGKGKAKAADSVRQDTTEMLVVSNDEPNGMSLCKKRKATSPVRKSLQNEAASAAVKKSRVEVSETSLPPTPADAPPRQPHDRVLTSKAPFQHSSDCT